MKLRRRLSALLVSLACAFGVFVVAAPPAAAATGNVYLVVFNSRCVGGGYVTQITGAVDWVWSGGDAGDNIIYPKVEFNRENAFNGRALCYRTTAKGGPYWINIPWWTFWPTSWNQTFYY